MTQQNRPPKVWLIDLPEATETAETIEVTMEGETFSVPALPNQTILDSLLAAKKNPVYSCMQGHCMACLATLISGSVGQLSPGILTDDQVKESEFLTCQAIPLCKHIKIDFGEF
ncbi:2Fe-2S iron-sulfur cluster binding domain-containing protein [Bdellovibrionales bacterium]|nr:2Fe-2S iron-sulfur cluster binding domain-containing protein [Bdellovibrionales bacterium]